MGEMKWHKKKRKKYNLQKVGYVPMDGSDASLSSIESYEERKGFEGQNEVSHWHQARDAADLGFIPVNEDEEYDAAASKMLHQNKKENIKQKRKQRSERENSVSSKISSIFRSNDKAKKKKKKRMQNTRRLSKVRMIHPMMSMTMKNRSHSPMIMMMMMVMRTQVMNNIMTTRKKKNQRPVQ